MRRATYLAGKVFRSRPVTRLQATRYALLTRQAVSPILESGVGATPLNPSLRPTHSEGAKEEGFEGGVRVGGEHNEVTPPTPPTASRRRGGGIPFPEA